MFKTVYTVENNELKELVKKQMQYMFKEELKLYLTQEYITAAVREVIADKSKAELQKWLKEPRWSYSSSGRDIENPAPLNPVYSYIDGLIEGEKFIDTIVERIKKKQLK